MKEGVTNCPKQNDECCLITANNNDNTCRVGSLKNTSCSKKEHIVIDKVPEETESQKNDISSSDIPAEITVKVNNLSHKKDSENIKHDIGSPDNHAKSVYAPDTNFPEQLKKAKINFMNSTPTEMETAA